MAQLKVVSKSGFRKDLVKKFNYKYILTHSFFMYFVLALGVYALVMILLSEEKQNQTFLWTFVGIGLLFAPLYVIITVLRSTKKEEKVRKDIIDCYELTKEKVVKFDSVDTEKIVLNWNLIARVVERKDSFEFYTINDAAFIIPKDSIIEGDINTVRVLVNKCLLPNKKGKIPFIVKDKEYKKEIKSRGKK